MMKKTPRIHALRVGRVINDQLKDIVKCYPVVAENGADYPFLTWKRTGFGSENSKDIYVLRDTVTMELLIAARTYSESLDLAERVVERLGHIRGMERPNRGHAPLYIADVDLVDSSEEYVANAYVQVLTIEVKLAVEC